MAPLARLATTADRVGRKPRYPVHNWQVRAKPFVIQPTLLAPVLAGETMKNALVQSRVVSEPIKNPLVGWHYEWWLFYVKLTDLDARDTLTSMLIDPETDISAIDDTSAQVDWYHSGAGINYSQMCLKRVTEDYFRNEGEAWDAWKVGNLPLASLNAKNWTDSLWTSAEYVEEDVTISTAGDNAFTMSELDKARIQWEVLQANNLMDMTYEDYLRTFGMSPAKEVSRSPELIKHVRDWTYPTNTVDPATGVPSSAVSWSIQERADKDRFFKEPGFLFAVTVVRPKVYMELHGSAASLMTSAYSWLPAIMRDTPETSVLQVAETTGTPFGAARPDGMYVDIRDLLLYGDQYLNFAATAADANIVDLPADSTLQRRYVDNDDILSLFVGASPTALVKHDGVCRFHILGTQSDMTPHGTTLGYTV